jgi:diguanylate cyclase (GGDEF)-like protein
MEEKQSKIMVVDDDPIVRDMLRAIIEPHNYIVTTKSDGNAALEEIMKKPDFDLIISDMNMPRVTGLELLNELKKQKYEIPLIFLTVNEKVLVAIEALKNGAEDYIIKDENIAETIMPAIRQTLEKNILRKHNKQLILDLERKTMEMEMLAMLDGLTGIPNRRYLDDVIVRSWKDCIRAKTPFGLAMIDIDFFKLYNDTYGHPAGDKCLISVAKALNDSLMRPSDLVARYGGEEFLVVLPDTDLKGVMMIAERLREKVAAIGIPHSASTVKEHVTISVGAGSVMPSVEMDLHDFIADIDKALYLAKVTCRNCVKYVQESS